jgi:hypothetical protein
MLIQRFGVDANTKLYVYYANIPSIHVDGVDILIVCALPARINWIFSVAPSSAWKPVRWLFDYRNLLFFLPQLTRLLRKKIQQDNPSALIISSFA